MRPRRDGMQDVELIDDQLLAGARLADGGELSSAAADGASALRFLRRWWPLLVLGSAAFVLPAAAQGWHGGGGSTEPADVPGVLAPVDGPLRELWTATGWVPSEVFDVGGMLVGPFRSESGTGPTTAHGVDAAHGVERWSVILDVDPGWNGQCVVTDGPVAGPGQAVLVCTVVDASAMTEAVEGLQWYNPTRVHLAVLDPSTGRTLRELPAGPRDVVASFGSDVVVTRARDDGNDVARINPRTGRTLWTSHLPVAAGDQIVYSAGVRVYGKDLLVDAGTRVWLLSATGRVEREWDDLDEESGWSLQLLAGGRLLRWSYVSNTETVVADLESGQAITIGAQESPWAGVDDGSAGGMLFTQASNLTARDARTGEIRWGTAGPVGEAVLLDGRVYSIGAQTGSVDARDAASGDVLWSTGGFGVISSLVTDGTLLFVVGPQAGAALSTLVALDLRDGTAQWSAPLTDRAQGLVVMAGHLFASVDGGRLIALG